VPAQHLAPAGGPVAADADADRSFADALDLEVQVLARPLVEVLRLDQPLPRSDRLHRGLGPGAPDDNESPRLHEPDRGRAVRRLQQCS
jgi:hypothetical protein